MSYGSAVLTQCENLQSRLDNFWETCDASRLKEPTPFFDFILSPFNNFGLNQVINPGKGKTRTINLTYFQRINEDNVVENAANPNCSADKKRGNCVEQYEIDTEENLQVTEFFEASDYRTVCQDDGQYLQEAVDRLINVLERRVATQTTDDSAALTGKWDSEVDSNPDVTVNANDQLVVRTRRTGALEEVFPWTMQNIDLALQQTGYCGTPICFSTAELFQYYQQVQSGCCANQGVDIGELASRFGKAVAYDRRIRAAYGDGEALVIQPGAQTLLMYAQNEFFEDGGVRRLWGEGNFTHMTVFGPSGLKMDLNTEVTCGGLQVTLTATTKLVALPDDMFGTGDNKDGVKFANQIIVDNS